MASKRKKRKSSKKASWNINWKDERLTKVFGVFMLLLGLFLAIAFISYCFNWQVDQDKVLKFSWSAFISGDGEVANWLGRFGAFSSNMFFFWGFGVMSFLFVAFFIKLGINRIKRQALSNLLPAIKYGGLSMVFGSILLEFLFQSKAFPWGGTFGSSTCQYLSSFLGNIGLGALLLFSLIAFLVWMFNPNFEQLNLVPAIPGMKSLNFQMPKIFDFSFSGVKAQTNNKRVPKNVNKATSANDYVPLKPSGNRPITEHSETESSILPEELEIPERKQTSLVFDLPKEEKGRAKKPITEPGKLAELEINSTEKILDNSLPIENVVGEGNKPKAINPTAEDVLNSEPYNHHEELEDFVHPTLDLLFDYEDQKVEIDRSELEANKDQIITTLLHYNIEITKIKATIGPTVTLYEIVPAPGVKISKIKNLENDIALSLAALGIRIIAPIPGKGTIGIEVPNKKRQIVALKEVLKSPKFQDTKMELPIALGKTISNEVFVADLAKMPHLLIAGATGQGKSVGINTILMSLLYKKHPSEVKLVLVDPKKVELPIYTDLEKHFLTYIPDADEPIVTETSKVIYTLNSLCIEMDERYNLLKAARVRHIKEYNAKFKGRQLNPNNGHKFLPYIVLVIDEFADLIMTAGKEVEMPIGRLAQLARAVGIHLIIATQRPSVKIITGLIKANFPARIAFKVTSHIDSRTILDVKGADQLIGNGDMLFSIGGNMIRLQCAFVDTPEVERVIGHIGDQKGFSELELLPEYKTEEDIPGAANLKYSDLDSNFEDAARLVVANQQGSTSMIQRKLKLGYNRAGRIMDQLEELNIVGPSEGSKAREVYIFNEMELMRHLDQLKNKV